jgi:nucleoside permease NupC
VLQGLANFGIGTLAARTKMPIRLRKLVGAILLIALVVTWALLAMTLAQSAVVKGNGVVEIIYYVVAGLGWVLPAMPLIRWMSRPDSA